MSDTGWGLTVNTKVPKGPKTQKYSMGTFVQQRDGVPNGRAKVRPRSWQYHHDHSW